MRLLATIQPTKAEVNCFHLTVRGVRLEYVGETITHCANLTTTKLLLNSTISTPNAKFITIDLNGFCYNTLMADHEYMQPPLKITPHEIINQYQL